jgi:hypothetical protein
MAQVVILVKETLLMESASETPRTVRQIGVVEALSISERFHSLACHAGFQLPSRSCVWLSPLSLPGPRL